VDGIPRGPGGRFKVCIPNPVRNICQRPYHSKNLYNVGGPHSASAATTDINGGKMDGFIDVALWGKRTGYCIRYWTRPSCKPLLGPANQPDQISYHTRQEIPSYWSYADYGVLYDHFFEPVASWTLPSHLYLVSAWAASCKDDYRVNSCYSDKGPGNAKNYPWADITILMRKYGVSWNYFVGDGTQLGCEGGTAKPASRSIPSALSPCNPTHSEDATVEGWMPISWMQSVKENDQRSNIMHMEDFYTRLDNEQLADVTWIIPSGRVSEHPGHASIGPGQQHVTRAINAIGSSPFWDDTAIFVSWDDWGGFYDHVKPPRIDGMGYGLRVPAFMISPYAKESFVNHDTLSTDAFLKFMEDRWMEGERLDGNTDGWKDPRPTVRESVIRLGDLTRSFDFSQSPRPAPILPLPPSEGPALWPYPETAQRSYGAGG
ncbi:MAG: phospholipase, partial [Actinobacteria bacterium]|nr:phospholipase [Actinomycetota bacterium]